MMDEVAIAADEIIDNLGQEITLGNMLGNILVERGITDLFCIPGDFTMQLSRELQNTHGLKLRTMTHEYSTTLAALGYALGKKIPSVVCFTYGVGVLNATNAIAQAYVEHVPMIVLSGYPGKRELADDIFLHHTVKDDDTQYRVMCEVTTHQVRISDIRTAQKDICEAIEIATERSRPVYIEIPRDMYLSKARFVPTRFTNPTRDYICDAACDAAKLSIKMLSDAKQAVIVPGLEVKRFKLEVPTKKIIEGLNLPWVASPISRETIGSAHPNFRGVFAGPASPVRQTRELVENADVLMLIGEPNSDVNMGIANKVSKDYLIHAYDGKIAVGKQIFAASTAEYIYALAEELSLTENSVVPKAIECHQSSEIFTASPKVNSVDEELSPYGIIEGINTVLSHHPETPLIVDCGDSFFMSLAMFPCDLVTSCLYMSMGIAVPGSIGYQIGSGKRPLVLVGDGAFHMTGLELMHAKRFETNPIVIILNNSNWTSLSADEGDRALTSTGFFEFSRMAHFLNIKSFTVTKSHEFLTCLSDAFGLNEPVLIDAQVDPSMRSYLCERFFEAIKSQYHLSPLSK